MLRWKLTASSESLHDETLHDTGPADSDSDETRFSPNPIKEPDEQRVLSDTDDENLLARNSYVYHVKPGLGQDSAGVMQTQCTEEMLHWTETQPQDPVDPHQGALAQEKSAMSETQAQDPVDPHQGALAQEMSAMSETQAQDPVDPHQGALAQEMSAMSETQAQDPVDPHLGALVQQPQCTDEMLAWSETQFDPLRPQSAVATQALQCTEEMLAWSETQLNPAQPQDLLLPDHRVNVGLDSENLILGQAEEKDVYIQIGGPEEWNTQVYSIHMDDVKRLLFSEPATTYPDTMNASSYQQIETKMEAKSEEVNSWDYLTKTDQNVEDRGGGESPMWVCSQTDMRLDIDSIISTLQGINFLGPHEADAILSGLCVPEDKAAGTATTSLPALQGRTSAAPLPSWARGRGRGKMPRTPRTPRARGRPRKRSRSSSNRPGRTRAPATAATWSSPEQELPRKSRKVCENTAVNEQPNYRRLQELRFLMQDILVGCKEPPTACEAEAMRGEVLDILGALAALGESRAEHSKADKTRLEQATQAAEKVLRQLQILLLDANSCESVPYQAETQPMEGPGAQLQHVADVTEARPNKQPQPKRRKSTTKRQTPRRSRRLPTRVTPVKASTWSTNVHHQNVSQDEGGSETPKQPGPMASVTSGQASSCTASDLRDQDLHQTEGCSDMQWQPDQAKDWGRHSATPNLESSCTASDSTFMGVQNLLQTEGEGCPQPVPSSTTSTCCPSTRKSPEPEPRVGSISFKHTLSSGKHAETNSNSGKILNQISVPPNGNSEMSEDLLNPERNKTSSSAMSESLLNPRRNNHIQEKCEGLLNGKEQTSKTNLENVLVQESTTDLRPQFKHRQSENTHEYCGSNDVSHNTLATTEKINTFEAPSVPIREMFHKKDKSDSLGNALIPKYIKDTPLKKSSNAEKDEYIWRGGPLALNLILLPKKSEFFSINDLPSDFWDNPYANIPDSWISELEWKD